MVGLFRTVGATIATLTAVAFLGLAVLVFLNKSPDPSFGKCQMRGLEASISKQAMDQYLDACMASEGFKLILSACNFSLERGPWCYLSNRVLWVN